MSPSKHFREAIYEEPKSLRNRTGSSQVLEDEVATALPTTDRDKILTVSDTEDSLVRYEGIYAPTPKDIARVAAKYVT